MDLSRFTAESVKVVLSGQGADEPWGGYQRHQAAAMLGLVQRVPGVAHRPLHALAEALPRNERAKRGARLLGRESGLEMLLSVFEITPARIRDGLLRGADHGAQAERMSLAEPLAAEADGRSVLDTALHLDTHLFLPDQLLVWGDKTSMASSLEQRVPFLDQELMAFVERIPAKTRMPRARRKWLYRRAMAKMVPPEVLDRRKHPFATPYDDWLRSGLGDEVRDRFAGDGPLADMIDPAVVGDLITEHQSGRSDHKRVLYCLLELSQWHREFVE
jgi:asparagine synthase (glutamine-hydrolysing)